MSSRVDSYSKEEAASPTRSREEGAGDQEAERQTIQSVQAHGPSGQGMEGQSSWPTSTTGRAASSDRYDRPEQPVRPVDPSIQQKAELAIPVLVPCNGETPLSFSVQGDEEVVDHEVTPKTQQYGAQRHLSVRGAKYCQMIIYLMKFLFSRSVCKGHSRFWLCSVSKSWAFERFNIIK